MFIDEVRIYVKAGDGGNGCLAFRREKFVPRGGPSGGDGGKGGDVTFVASPHRNTLLHFRFNPEHKAQRGRHGEGSNRTGHEGESIEVETPSGTVMYNDATGELIHDFTTPGEKLCRARGEARQRSRSLFHHQAPTEHEDGKPGDEFLLRLAGMFADVGLVGISQRREIHADLAHPGRASQDRRLSLHYARTKFRRGQRGWRSRLRSTADIPGLIEGAHEGHGLGIQFLKHIERTRLLAHLVDVSEATGRDPVHDFEIVMSELASFSEDLAAKPMIVVATKIDAAQDEKRIKAIERGLPS